MNVLESHITQSPYGKQEECAKFIIDTINNPFLLSDVAIAGDEHTLSFWLRSDVNGSVSTCGRVFTATSEWKKHTVTFRPTSRSLTLNFSANGAYYIYHIQLETGNKPSDWTPAPEDIESDINDAQNTADEARDKADDASTRIGEAETTIVQLADSIASLVRDGNGGSLVRQDADGLWYFDIGGLEKNISDTASDLDSLSTTVSKTYDKTELLNMTAEELRKRTEYVRSYTDENDQPCLELGEGDSVFKVRITNTDIQFVEDTSVPAKLNRKMLVIEKAMVKDELQFGDDEVVTGVWLWKRRSNGNLGLSWKEVVR